jgi:hypothetical protein
LGPCRNQPKEGFNVAQDFSDFQGTIAADSRKGKAYGLVYEMATQIRGPILDHAISIDLLITEFLTLYFCPKDDRRRLPQSEVFSGASSFSKNINLLKIVLEQSFPSFKAQNPHLIAQLNEFREFRNLLAHGFLDTTPEWMGEEHTDRIQLVGLKKGKAKTVVVTFADRDKMLGKSTAVLLQLAKLLREGGHS